MSIDDHIEKWIEELRMKQDEIDSLKESFENEKKRV